MLKSIPVGAKIFHIFAFNDYLINRKDEVFKLFDFIHIINFYKIIEFKIFNIILFLILIIFFSFLILKRRF